jgi:hypothetical protein
MLSELRVVLRWLEFALGTKHGKAASKPLWCNVLAAAAIGSPGEL